MNNLQSVSKHIMTVSAMSLALTCACAHGGVYQSVFTLNSPYCLANLRIGPAHIVWRNLQLCMQC